MIGIIFHEFLDVLLQPFWRRFGNGEAEIYEVGDGET